MQLICVSTNGYSAQVGEHLPSVSSSSNYSSNRNEEHVLILRDKEALGLGTNLSKRGAYAK